MLSTKLTSTAGQTFQVLAAEPATITVGTGLFPRLVEAQ